MSFGLLGAAPNFQKAIDIILKPVLGKYASVYMDDVIISSPSFVHHVEHLREVFRLLQEAGLTLNKYKCNFGCEKLKYLGLVISKDGITTDKSKVKAIIEMKPPKNAKEAAKFLGMTQWYQEIIKGYADLCEPLYQLNKKYRKFIWLEETQVAFESIQCAIMEAPVLKLPDFNVPFKLFTDATSIGLGAVHTQDQRPITYSSRTLNNLKRNYTVTERECLVVIWALNFRTYFGLLSVKVIMDHAALTKLTNDKNLSSRMIRWALKLAKLNVGWEHRPGVQNVVTNVLSTYPVESIVSENIACGSD
ncbi:retrovirus-related Pol polyprotein from transposon opus [Trichonephila clavipes]|uniref:RNA-directed DNA polymerase n=1 Tax=Trichonephila clavipes TaxID=2585209 RepID=A0A8X6W365_TRICX|nr:retrovirus-related Pol polyprotein from transposon opus [Trichonephila clavipes]